MLKMVALALKWKLLRPPSPPSPAFSSEDDNVLVQGVAGSPFAIGYFGYAFYVPNTDVLKALAINEVAPSAAALKPRPTHWPAHCSSTAMLV